MCERSAEIPKEEKKYTTSPVAGALAVMILEESLRKGHSIEIPSLGITIHPKSPLAESTESGG